MAFKISASSIGAKAFLLLSSLSLGLWSGCKKGVSSGCKYFNAPSSLALKIVTPSGILSDSILALCKISYLKNGNKTFVADLGVSHNSAAQHLGILWTRDIVFTSADDQIKTYYLEYPNNLSRDTLLIDYDSPTPTTNCLYAIKSLKYNDKNMILDTSLYYILGDDVFVISKR